ncbi:MAG: T9SS type A sorting domain-containing protein [Armatimonadetes bacterium]|nr:T9SS type A sorting domain-containing protein [Armatimonadota bacterium]
MKKMLLAFLVLCNTILFANVTLNKYGHIQDSKQILLTAKYYIENGEYYIDIDGNTLIGNSLFEIENGYLTLITIEENVPTWLRIYNKNGNLKFEKTFKKVINLTTSENKKYSAFFNGNHLQVLDNSTFQIEQFERSIIFDIDNYGNPIFIDDKERIHFKGIFFRIESMHRVENDSENSSWRRSTPFDSKIQKVLFYNNIPLIFTEDSVYQIDDKLEKNHSFNGNFFIAEVIDNSLYFVEKIRENKDIFFNLYKTNDFINIKKLDEKVLNRNLNRTHELILAPLNYGAPNYPFPVGNSYGEIQQYGYNPYLHPGVDFLGEDYQEVYAVHDGFVKAVLTTGGDPYWRVAIANEDVSTETEGYLYAHLNEDSIVHTVGDSVSAGDLLGTLYPWGWYDFTHIHFARLQDEGTQWFGTWWTIDNPHIDVTNIQDTIPPIFENAQEFNLFAFRDINGDYLEPLDLSGEFDIIAKCHDIENSDWRIDIWDISFSLHPAGVPDSTVYEQFSFAYDMPIDTYFSNYWTDIVLNTIYSRDATCYSIGNYDEREYYHIITNSNGDSLITEEDEAEIFDSTDFLDGAYWLKVTARDASLNTTVDSMIVYFNNGINSTYEEIVSSSVQLFQNYPNPFNPETIISFSLTTEVTEDTELVIYNIKGQKIKQYSILDNQSLIIWNGTNQNNKPVSTGIYFYKLKIDGKDIASQKMILLK